MLLEIRFYHKISLDLAYYIWASSWNAGTYRTSVNSQFKHAYAAV